MRIYLNKHRNALCKDPVLMVKNWDRHYGQSFMRRNLVCLNLRLFQIIPL